MGTEFGENLRNARKAVGWSQERLAQEAALESKGYISALEGGKRPMPPGRTLEALARALGVTIPDLVGEQSGRLLIMQQGNVSALQTPDWKLDRIMMLLMSGMAFIAGAVLFGAGSIVSAIKKP